MANDTNSRRLQKPWGFQISTIVQIWIFISTSISYSCGSVDNSSLISTDITYSTMEIVNQTHSVNISDIQVTATMTVSYSASVSETPPLPSNCYHVCKCNHSTVYLTTSMVYNMSESSTYSVNMTHSYNMTTMSVDMTSSDVSMSPTPSSVSMSYTASVNATAMNYNSSVWPTPSSSISAPFVCSNESCWWEVECYTYSPHIPMTSYSITPSLSSSEAAIKSSSVAPTEPSCQEDVDCNGDCGGSAVMDCGVCIEGNTGVTSLRDCNRDCNGTARNSSCGVCLSPGTRDPTLDCNEQCSGEAEVDECNVCTGGSTGLVANYLKDACGVCNGTNSTCVGCDGVPYSGKTFDACGMCGGDSSTCTDIMETIPKTIASCQPNVLVIGAGLDGGDNALCVLYDPVSGDMVVNVTATSRNLTHAQCQFQPWVNISAGVYNLSVVITQSSQPNVKTNTSLQVYYYSCANLSLTSVEPNEVLLDELPQYVTLMGSGFFDWEETVCYYGSQETSDVVYVNATHMMCKIAAVETSTQFSLSISMDGGLRRVGDVNVTVYDRAPNVTSAKFSDTAAEIVAHFNKEVEFTGAETCVNFFESATVNKLGERPDCYLVTTTELEIFLGDNATIVVGDNLEFKNNVFKSYGEPFSRFLSGSFPVDPPTRPLTPVPEITGPDTLSSCGNLTLSGFQSFGGGGRALNFQWTLESPGGGAGVADINTILSTLSSNDDRIKIPGSLLTAGTTYVFQLGVANFLNPSSFVNATHSVVKSADPVPVLTLNDPVDPYVSDPMFIKATAVVAPCVNDTRVNFLWTVTCPNDASAQQKVETSPSFQITRTQATISISKGVLTGDVTCTFNVTGSMNYNPSVKSSVAVDIKALPTPLEPAIVGGDRQIGRDSGAIKLDALTQTVDPDESSQDLSCNWKCEDEDGGFCYSIVNKGQLIFASVSGCESEVQSNHFTAGKTYKISVDVSKGSRTASTSISLSVVEGNPPQVSVGEAYVKALVHERVTLEGYYETSVQPSKVEWSSVQEQGFAHVDISGLTLLTEFFADGESYAWLTIPAGLLKKGSKYKFKLTVNDGSKDGMASMVVEIRSGPTSGSLAVDKTVVQALFDDVVMSAPRWTVEADALPLRYSFGQLVEQDVCEVWSPPSNIPEWTDIMPDGNGPNNILTLCVIVEDKFGSFAMATKNITSTPPNAAALTQNALDDLLDNNVQAQLQSGNVDKALSAMSNIASTVQGSNDTSDELKRNISQKAQGFILVYVDSAFIGEDNAVPLLTALVKTDAAAADNSSNMAGAAVKILGGLGDNPISDDQAGDFLKWMGDLAGDSFDDNDEDFKDDIVEVFDELADNLGSKLVLGDDAREVYDERLGVVRVQVSTLQAEMPISSRPGAPKFDPGESLAAQFSAPRKCGGGKTCSGVLLKFSQYKENLITPDASKQASAGDVAIDSSQVISLEFKDPNSKKKIAVNNLSRPLKLTFSMGEIQVGREAACKYFNKTIKVWISDGMTAIGPVNGTLICESTHATFFAPSQDGKNSTNATTTAPPATTVGAKEAESDKDYTAAIVGGVIGGIVFIALVVGGVWWCSKNKNKTTGRVSPETPEGHA